ncbi:MAG: LacI family transcriptional regulator [Oscillospiraceae bacterium]|nr:LacI family transcriptional regulator [Oscillospiraceae bacterium]
MVTIDDIAAEAGVSNTTVSNVIHGRTNRVSKKTIDSINKIIKERGYVPNMSARALASNSSKVVAIINNLDSDKSANFMEDPFHNIFIGAVEKALRSQGYYLMLRTVGSSKKLLEFLRNWNMDGLFLTGVFEDDDIYAALSNLKVPVVLSDSYLSDYGQMVNVGLQDFEGAKLATEYLIKNGHRRIIFAGPQIRPSGVVQQRLKGYRSALEAAGISFDEKLVFESEFLIERTLELGAEIAARDDVTAVFATADILAAGIMSGIQQAGRKVPEDFSIVGFDDIDWCRMTMPTLTTVHQDAKQKGEISAERMITLLNGGEILEQNKILPVRLVERESVRSIL